MPWTTKDYFDPFPGIEAGLARRRQLQSEEQFRETQKQHALDLASQDLYHSQQMAMEAGKMSAHLGVDPVMGPDGKFDPVGTAKMGVLKKATDEAASALGLKHAGIADMTGTDAAFFPTPEEQKLMQTDAYTQARSEGEFKLHFERVKDEAVANRAARLRNTPPKLVEVGGKKFAQNQETGALIAIEDPLPTTASEVTDSQGKVIGYNVGKKTIPRHKTLLEQANEDFGQPQSGGATNAPSSAGSVMRFTYTKDGKEIKPPK